MFEAAAMLTGLWVLWLLLTQQWSGAEQLAYGAVAALACVVAAARFSRLRGAGPFSRALPLLVFAISRAGAVARGAGATVRAAIAADVTLRPALVRVKTRPASDAARAAFASLLSATPGMVVVDADDASMLAHVLHEDAIEPSALVALEARAIQAVDGRRA